METTTTQETETMNETTIISQITFDAAVAAYANYRRVQNQHGATWDHIEDMAAAATAAVKVFAAAAECDVEDARWSVDAAYRNGYATRNGLAA